MLQNALAPRPLATERSPWLRGTLGIPGDTAIALLGRAAAAVARGESVVEGAPETQATAAVVGALQALGVPVERRAQRLHVTGLGAGGLLEPMRALDLGGTALGLELVMGLAGIHNFPTDFRGNPELSARPLGELLTCLEAFGVVVTDPDEGRLPLRLCGPGVAVPAALTLPRGAFGAKAALLFAALGAPGVSSFIEPHPTWNHAERMLSRFGAAVAVTAGEGESVTIEVGGLPQLHARQVVVPADPSLAAYGVVAACIVPASELHFASLLVNPLRTGLFSALLAMGADVSAHALRTPGDEEVADLVVRHAGLRGIVLAAEDVAPLLEELPLLAVSAACAEGETVLHLPPGLPLTEHGRIAAIARGLRANGVAAEATEEAFIIEGTPSVRGGGGGPAPAGAGGGPVPRLRAVAGVTIRTTSCAARSQV